MTKTKTQPLNFENNNKQNKNVQENIENESLSGSKKVKNRHHSRQNHGEGS